MKRIDAKTFAEDFDTIDRRLAAGEITEGQAVVARARLTSEMKEVNRPTWQKALIFIFWAILLLTIGVILARCTASSVTGT